MVRGSGHPVSRHGACLALTAALLVASVQATGVQARLETGAGESAGVVSAQPSSRSLQVVVENGRLSLQAHDTALADVLRVIAQKAGLRLSLGRDMDTPVTHRAQSRPLERALRDLLRGRDFALVYDSARPGGLSELHVYGASTCPEPAAVLADAAQAEAGSIAVSETADRLRGLAALEGGDPAVSLAVLSAALAGENDVLLRRAAVLWLSRLDARAIPVLAGALRDTAPQVRADAVRAIGRIGEDDALTALRPAFADDDASVRLQAVRAFARVASDADTGDLERVLTEDASGSVRREALLSLLAFGGPVARQALAVAALDSDPVIRAAAAGILKGLQ